MSVQRDRVDGGCTPLRESACHDAVPAGDPSVASALTGQDLRRRIRATAA
jgi:hypothetical protein